VQAGEIHVPGDPFHIPESVAHGFLEHAHRFFFRKQRAPQNSPGAFASEQGTFCAGVLVPYSVDIIEREAILMAQLPGFDLSIEDVK
jgi:hypothetical protein